MKPRFLTALSTVLFVAGCGASSGTPEPGADGSGSARGETASGSSARPASVPADYQITPNGYFHPSCLVEVHHGEQVAADGNLLQADGTERSVPACTAPHFDRTGKRIESLPIGVIHPLPPKAPLAPPVQAPGISHAWLADFSETIENVTWLSANFKVPLAPYRQSSEVVFFFNGLEPADSSQIVQPVLQWNQSGHANRWTISSWYYVSGSNYYFSTPVNVNPGDTIGGYLYPSGTSWVIGMNVNGAYATDLTANTGGKTFDQVFGGVLEVYNINSCDELPEGEFEFFSDEYILQKGLPVTPSWSAWNVATQSPNCTPAAIGAGAVGYITWLDN